MPVLLQPYRFGASGGGGGDLALTYAAKQDWIDAYGVTPATGYTRSQILAETSGLTTYTGKLTTTSDGQVIEDRYIKGCIEIKHNNVTIRRCFVSSATGIYAQGGDNSGAAAAIGTGGTAGNPGTVTGTIIEDCELDGFDVSGDTIGIGAAHYLARRCNIHGYTKGLWMGLDCTLQDSIVHSNNPTPEGAHGECVDADTGTDILIEDCWLAMDGGLEENSGAIQFGGTYGAGDNLACYRSFLAGGEGQCINLHPFHTNVVIVDNAFSDDHTNGDLMAGGLPPDCVFTGNYVAETGVPYLGP